MTDNVSLQVKVTSKTQETDDIASFELVSLNGEELPAFTAGAHIDVNLPGGIARQYSLCNPPSESHRYKIGVLKDPESRGGSVAIHEQVHEGDVLDISAPRNHFPLEESANNSLLLAGGIGVTPILCMAERLSSLGLNFEMHYCTRSEDRMAFRSRIASSAFSESVAEHFDNGAEEQKLDLKELLAKPEAGKHLYVCGPKGFMDAVLSISRDAGWPEEQLHYEFFSAEVVHNADDGSFEVELAKSGNVVTVGPEQTVVEALAENGIELPVSCEQGVCGTCLVNVLDGEPDHRDMYLTPGEQEKNDQFLPCCSRSNSPRLVLDI